jgi:hypothetical protein
MKVLGNEVDKWSIIIIIIINLGLIYLSLRNLFHQFLCKSFPFELLLGLWHSISFDDPFP